MKLTRGLFLLIFGTCLGVITGIGLRVLERYLALEVVEVLQEEAAGACPCHLEYDTIALSLFTMHARCTNVRMVHEGKTVLRFESIDVDASLKNILDREILLTKLTLSGGLARGVSEDSPTFKFIDYLSTPLPPELSKPNKLSAKLLLLEIKNSRFIEELGGYRLVGNDLDLMMRRNERDFFDLFPSIRKLELVSKSRLISPEMRSINLGRVDGKMTIEDAQIFYRDFKTILPRSLVKLEGYSETSKGNLLHGDASGTLELDDIPGLPMTVGKIDIVGKLAGTLGRPMVPGRISLGDQNQIVIGDAEIPYLVFTNLDGEIEINGVERPPSLLIKSAMLTGEEKSAQIEKPIYIGDSAFRGSLRLSTKHLPVNEVAAIQDLEALVELGGNASDPRYQVSGSGTLMVADTFPIAGLQYKLQTSGDDLDFDVWRRSSHSYGDDEITAHGRVLNFADSNRVGENIEIAIKNATIGRRDAEAFAVLLDGKVNVSGPLNGKEVHAEGALDISPSSRSTRLQMATKLSVDKGVVQLTSETEDKSVQAAFEFPFDRNAKGTFSATSKGFAIERIIPSLSCVTNTSALSYSFPVVAPLTGAGSLDIESLMVGCAPYGLTMPQPTKLPITQGTLAFDALELTNNPSTIRFQGGVSLEKGFQLDARSHLSLESLLGLVRSIDDIKGDLSTELSLRGKLGEPTISGQAMLKDSLFSIEAVDIFGSHINGSLTVDKNLMSFKDFSGNLNGGTFSINGSLNPLQDGASDFEFHLKNILVEPGEGVSAVWSGTFRIGETENALPLLSGNVEIHSAEIRRQLDIVTILKSIRDLVSTRVAKQRSFSRAPLASIDLNVSMPGNFLVLSNWASAELSGNLRMTGDPADPAIDGEIATISGWFGFKNRQFQITSGRLIFSPLSHTPELDLLSETLVRSHFGDNVYMILEVKGPADNPRVKLSSDSGLGERDLLSLLTTGQSPTQQGIFSSRGYGFSLEDRPLFDATKPFSLMNFLRDLTRIDVLSIEPTFNARTGAVEPTFIAQRKLTEDVSLFAQNSFGSGSSDSEAGASLALAPSLALIGSVESSSTRQNNALAVNLSYTILAAQNPFVSFEFVGNEKFTEIEILRNLRLTQISRVRHKDLERLEQQLTAVYRKEGYFNATVDFTCQESDGYCRSIHATIQEREKSYISTVAIQGDAFPSFISPEKVSSGMAGRVASQDNSDELKESLIRRLRSEGYIGARLSISYESEESGADRKMVVNSTIGRPVSFIFNGNTVFNAEELLETINLFGRKQPFGSNTISILVDNIERKYREAGYLFASIIYRKDLDQANNRVIYTVDIKEEGYAPVSNVKFEGLSVFTEGEMKRILARDNAALVESVFLPSVALREEIENNTNVLKALYVNQGYPATKVSFDIKPNIQTKGVDIIYRIREGRPEKRQWLRFEGLSDEIEVPIFPDASYTIPEANRLISTVLENTRDRGFLSASFRSKWSGSEEDPVVVAFDMGSRTTIANIKIEGLSSIAENVVTNSLVVHAGEPWSIERIDESRRKLLHLGLFSHVETLPEDGALDSAEENLLIRVSERPLTTVGAGVGANSAFGLHLFGETIDRSLFGDGRLLSLRFDTYYSQESAEITQGTANLRYLDPSFLSEKYIFTEDLRYQRLQRATQEFDLNRVSLATSVQRTFSEWPTLSVGHTLLSEELNNVPDDSVIGEFDTGTVRLGFFSGSASYDRRDNPFNPTRGYALNGDFRVAAKAFGSQAEYSSLGGGASTIRPLTAISPRLSFAFHTRIASSWVFGDTDEVPISQRFYLGGRSSVRGFRENQLGPRGAQGDIIGGDLLFLGSSELQYMLLDLFSLHLFLDTGNVYLKDQSSGIEDLRESAGVGFRYRSPIGPIGFDVGHPLDEKSGEPSVRVHFSVGSNF